MAKEITLRSSNGKEIYYPKTVTDLVYDNETGKTVKEMLNTLIANINKNATFVGIATPTTDPGTPEGNVFYVTSIPGVYTNFNIDKPKADYDISFLCYNVSDSQWKFFDIYQLGNIDYISSNLYTSIS